VIKKMAECEDIARLVENKDQRELYGAKNLDPLKNEGIYELKPGCIKEPDYVTEASSRY